jgi:hypothetical protein
MSIEKSEIKVVAAHEIGCRLDDALEASTKDLYRLEGAVTAFKQAAQAVEGLAKHIDKEMDEGKFDLEQAKIIKRYVERAHQMMTNLGIQSDANRVAQTGKVSGMQQAVQLAKQFRDAEESKAQTLRVAYEKLQSGEDPGRRSMGLHPGMTIKEQRLAEQVSQAPAQEPVSQAPEAAPEPAPKKRGRKPKA